MQSLENNEKVVVALVNLIVSVAIWILPIAIFSTKHFPLWVECVSFSVSGAWTLLSLIMYVDMRSWAKKW